MLSIHKSTSPYIILLAINFLLGTTGFGQQNPQTFLLEVPKGSFVVLKIPSRIIGFERVSGWSGNVSYGTIIEQSDKSGLMVGGLNDWRTAGWTLMRQLSVDKVSREKNHVLVELKDPLFNIKLRFDSSVRDVNVAFREVAFIGSLSEFENSEYYKQEIVGKILPLVFKNGLSSIPTPRKLSLLKELAYVDAAIKFEKYKGANYLSIDVGGDTQIYNTIRVDQPHRIGNSLNQRVLAYVKRIARAIKFHPDIDGIKVSILVPYKNFVTEQYNEPSYDRLELYAAMDVIQQFVDDDLTNQEFVEESILLVNGNRQRTPNIESL